MRLTIEQDGVKRSLADKPFGLCLDVDTAKVLIHHLGEFLDGGAQYGWVEVYEPRKRASDNAPLPWVVS